MLRTAQERWPLSELLVVPIPVQGEVAPIICGVLSRLAEQHHQLRLDAIVLARGGGSREDLMVFDDADVCRIVGQLPSASGNWAGHEDDLTVADLVADHRAATPTAAMVTLMPSKESAQQTISQRRTRLGEYKRWRLEQASSRLKERHLQLHTLRPAVASTTSTQSMGTAAAIVARSFTTTMAQSGLCNAPHTKRPTRSKH